MFVTEVHIKEKLNPNWADWFEGMQVQVGPDGNTVLCGSLPDRAAVYGVLSRLGSLGITLVSVTCRDEKDTGPPER